MQGNPVFISIYRKTLKNHQPNLRFSTVAEQEQMNGKGNNSAKKLKHKIAILPCLAPHNSRLTNIIAADANCSILNELVKRVMFRICNCTVKSYIRYNEIQKLDC